MVHISLHKNRVFIQERVVHIALHKDRVFIQEGVVHIALHKDRVFIPESTGPSFFRMIDGLVDTVSKHCFLRAH